MNYAHITLSYSYTLTINTICCVLLFLHSLVFVEASSSPADSLMTLEVNCATPNLRAPQHLVLDLEH